MIPIHQLKNAALCFSTRATFSWWCSAITTCSISQRVIARVQSSGGCSLGAPATAVTNPHIDPLGDTNWRPHQIQSNHNKSCVCVRPARPSNISCLPPERMDFLRVRFFAFYRPFRPLRLDRAGLNLFGRYRCQESIFFLLKTQLCQKNVVGAN